jgi:MHS family proline/betaine transporter-like MFS transporter
MAMVTASIGFLPINHSHRFLPLALILFRLLQGFFSSGETINGAMYVLDHANPEKKGLFSALFDASSLAGFLIASILIWFYKAHDLLDVYWRTLFWLGAISFIPALILKKPAQNPATETIKPNLTHINSLSFLKVFMTSGYSYAFFSLCFTFSNGALGFISSITPFQNQHQTTLLFLIDLLLLPLFGLFSRIIEFEKLMRLSVIASTIFIPFSFFIISSVPPAGLFLIRLIWTALGALFSANLYQFYQRLFPQRKDLMTLSLAVSLGSCLLGHCFSSMALLIYNLSRNPFLIGLYFSILSITVWAVLHKKIKKNLICFEKKP